MRLIDADKCPCVVCEDTRNSHCTYEHRSCNKFCEWISREAYDIDKVKEIINQTEKESNVARSYRTRLERHAIGYESIRDYINKHLGE